MGGIKSALWRSFFRDRWLLWLFGAGLAMRLAFALLPLRIHLSLLEDDAWMVTAIARNAALGNGISADGVNPTNGFHPLYPLTLGVLPYLLAPDDLAFGFTANMVICAVINALTMIPLAMLLQQFVPLWAARAGVALFALNTHLIRLSVNAMETSLALLLLVSLVLAWTTVSHTRWSAAIKLGGLAALAILARLDNGLMGASIGLVWLFEIFRQRNNIKFLFAYGIAATLVLVPYFVRNLTVFGGVTPSSGRALAYLHSYAESFTLTGGTQFIPYNSIIPLSFITSTPILVLLAGIIFATLAWLSVSSKEHKSTLAIITLYTFVITMYYSYIQQQGNPRYYSGISTLLIVPLMIIVTKIINNKTTFRVIGVSLAMAAIIFFNSIEAWSKYTEAAEAGYLSQTTMYEAALWMAQNVPVDARVAARNSGIYQYYSRRTILNIDGKLNHEIIPVLEKRGLLSYLRSKNIEYIIDLQDIDEYIEFYSAELSEADPHHEIGLGEKLTIYARLLGRKAGLPVDPPKLEQRTVERTIKPLTAVAPVWKSFVRPNDPANPITIYRLLP